MNLKIKTSPSVVDISPNMTGSSMGSTMQTATAVSTGKISLSPNIVTMLNYRINAEELSSRIYLSMHLWLENKGYLNAAKLWGKFASEENNHANWAREHLLSYGIQPMTYPIAEVPNSFAGLDDIIRQTHAHEHHVSSECVELSKAALSEGDMNTFALAQKFVAEQTEEINKTQTLMDLLEVYGTERLALALLDHAIADLL